MLIVAGDPMVAALLGMLLDPNRHEPVYPQDGERIEEAVGRLRPPIAIVLDGALESARSDLFLARADRARATMVLFTPPTGGDAVRALAEERGVPCFSLPVDRAGLTRILDDALGRAGVAFGAMALTVGGVATLIASLPPAW